jgi:hypothetical protein
MERRKPSNSAGDHPPAAFDCNATLQFPGARWSNPVLRRQHHAKPGFALQHARISVSSLFERNCLDHRADVLQNAEASASSISIAVPASVP